SVQRTLKRSSWVSPPRPDANLGFSSSRSSFSTSNSSSSSSAIDFEGLFFVMILAEALSDSKSVSRPFHFLHSSFDIHMRVCLGTFGRLVMIVSWVLDWLPEPIEYSISMCLGPYPLAEYI